MANVKIFKLQPNITTTISDDLQLLAFKKGIKWSEALAFGIKELAHKEYKEIKGEIIINETEKSKVLQLQSAVYQMQKKIDELNKEHVAI